MIKALINLILSLFKKDNSSSLIKISDPNEVLVHEARMWIGTKEEGGDNSGATIEMFQRAVNPYPNKESWCADFVVFCVQQVEQKLNVKSKLYRSELVQDLWTKSPVTLRQTKPSAGCVVIWKKGNTNLGHAGIIESVNEDGTMCTIEGNTGPQAVVINRNGDGVYRRTRTQIGTPIMSVVGFLKPF